MRQGHLPATPLAQRRAGAEDAAAAGAADPAPAASESPLARSQNNSRDEDFPGQGQGAGEASEEPGATSWGGWKPSGPSGQGCAGQLPQGRPLADVTAWQVVALSRCPLASVWEAGARNELLTAGKPSAGGGWMVQGGAGLPQPGSPASCLEGSIPVTAGTPER